VPYDAMGAADGCHAPVPRDVVGIGCRPTAGADRRPRPVHRQEHRRPTARTPPPSPASTAGGALPSPPTALGDAFEVIELDSSPGNPDGFGRSAHSVLTVEVRERPGHAALADRERVTGFLREHLAAGPAGPAEA